MAKRPDRTRVYAVAIGLIFSLGFVALSLRRIDLHALWQALLGSQWWPWYVLAPVIYMAGHFVRGIRCALILRPHREVSTAMATNVVIIGYAANNLLPARMGEFVRAYVLSRNAGVSASLSLAITFLERVFDGLAITLILVLAGMRAPLPAWGVELLWVAAGVFLGASAGIALVMAAKPFVLRAASTITNRLPARIGGRALSILDRAIGATDCLRHGGLAVRILALSVVVWIVEGSMFLVILPAFGLPASPVWAGMAMSVTNLGILVPSSPGYIGPFHYFCMQALGIFGVPRETALGYAIMAHLLYYVPVTIWGVSALAAYGLDVRTAARRARAVNPAAVATDLPAG